MVAVHRPGVTPLHGIPATHRQAQILGRRYPVAETALAFPTAALSPGRFLSRSTWPEGVRRAQNAGMELFGKVVVVPVEWEHAAGMAGRMAGRGATVVLVGPDGDAAGRLAATIEEAGSGRPAIFVADGSAVALDALADFLAEMFRDR